MGFHFLISRQLRLVHLSSPLQFVEQTVVGQVGIAQYLHQQIFADGSGFGRLQVPAMEFLLSCLGESVNLSGWCEQEQ